MRVCCAQISQVFDDADTAFSRAEEFVSSCGADMVLFCEQFATGWRPQGSTVSGDAIKERWLALAKKYHTCIVGSYQKKTDDPRPQNVMLVCSPDGEVIAEYAKLHLFSPGGEDKFFSSGTEPVTFSFGGLKFGCAVCFDLRFPELFREYLRQGCECMIVQAAWPAARVADWELLLRARALENRGFVIGCGCIGFDAASGTDYCGRSLVCDYEGRILADAGVFEGEASWDVPDGLSEDVRAMRKKWGI